LTFSFSLVVIIDYKKEEKEAIRVSQGPNIRWTGGRNLWGIRRADKNPGEFWW